MELFFYYSGALKPGEEMLRCQQSIRLYNGEEKCKIRKDTGKATITNMQIIWDNSELKMSLELCRIVLCEKEYPKGGFQFHGKSPKIVLHLNKSIDHSQGSSPFPPSPCLYIKLSFSSGGMEEFYNCLQQALNDRRWEKPLLPTAKGQFRAGIVGIERQLEKDARDTEKNISEAFQDINSLIEMAKPMVHLAESIANKMKEKQGGISDDDTITFRQQLLSLGIKDPVTKEKYGSGHVYFEKLSVEMSRALEEQVKECGGMMSLVEAFCRINRARGVQLVSPADLMNACHMLEGQRQPLRLRELGNKVLVLQHISFDDDMCVAKTLSLLDQYISLTPEEYATIVKVPVLIAKHSLITTENSGDACRDDCVEGLRFYASAPFYIEDDKQDEDE